MSKGLFADDRCDCPGAYLVKHRKSWIDPIYYHLVNEHKKLKPNVYLRLTSEITFFSHAHIVHAEISKQDDSIVMIYIYCTREDHFPSPTQLRILRRGLAQIIPCAMDKIKFEIET